MATRCPNCDLVLGWRLVPGFSRTWQCRCGVTVDHTGASFLEAWFRVVVLTSVALGTATVFVLRSRGAIAPTSPSQLALLAAGAGLSLAAGLTTVGVPLAILVAKRLGIPVSTSDKIGAATTTLSALVSCLVLAAVAQEAIRSKVNSRSDANEMGNGQQAVFENKKW